eukprot:Platyproteum_vivax@DN5895_c0_g1_i2.p1
MIALIVYFNLIFVVAVLGLQTGNMQLSNPRITDSETSMEYCDTYSMKLNAAIFTLKHPLLPNPGNGLVWDFELGVPKKRQNSNFLFSGDTLSMYKGDPTKMSTSERNELSACQVSVPGGGKSKAESKKQEVVSVTTALNSGCHKSVMKYLSETSKNWKASAEKKKEAASKKDEKKKGLDEWQICYWSKERLYNLPLEKPCFCCKLDVLACAECLACLTEPEDPTSEEELEQRKEMCGNHSHVEKSTNKHYSADACKVCGDFLPNQPGCTPLHNTRLDDDGVQIKSASCKLTANLKTLSCNMLTSTLITKLRVMRVDEMSMKPDATEILEASTYYNSTPEASRRGLAYSAMRAPRPTALNLDSRTKNKRQMDFQIDLADIGVRGELTKNIEVAVAVEDALKKRDSKMLEFKAGGFVMKGGAEEDSEDKNDSGAGASLMSSSLCVFFLCLFVSGRD